MLSLVYIFFYIRGSEAIFSRHDAKMPSCSQEEWRHICQNTKFFTDYDCIRSKFGQDWRNKIPHTRELIEELKVRQKSLKEGSLQSANDRIGATIVARIISNPLKFWSRIIQQEVQEQEIPVNYLGSHALGYRDPDMVKIVSSFFPIMHLTAQRGGTSGNRVVFTNTKGCNEEDEIYLLQNKLEYLNLFEAGSEKQAMVDYTALVQYINSLSEVMKKGENKLIYHHLGDFAPFAAESSPKAHLLFSEQLASYNIQALDNLITLLEERVTDLENVGSEDGSGSRLDGVGARGQKGDTGVRGERGSTGTKGQKGMSGGRRAPDIGSRNIGNVVEEVLTSEGFKRAMELAKEDRLSEMILGGLNSTIGGVMDAVDMKLTLELVITASIVFSISTTVFLGLNTVCIFLIFRRNRKLDAKRLLRKKEGNKPTIKPRSRKR